MANILEFEGMQNKLDIQWEVISNSSSQETPHLYPPLNDERDPLLLQLSEQAFHQDLSPSPSTISNLSQATFTAPPPSLSHPSILDDNGTSSGEDIEDGLGLDFFFDINNPAFLHSFAFTLLFLLVGCFVSSSIVYLSRQTAPNPSTNPDHPNSQYHQSQAGALKTLSFETAGQAAGKAIDGALCFFSISLRNLSKSVETGELQEKMVAWRDEGFENLKKVLVASDGILGKIPSTLATFTSAATIAFSGILDQLNALIPVAERVTHINQCHRVANTILHRICSYFWPPIPVVVAKEKKSLIQRFFSSSA